MNFYISLVFFSDRCHSCYHVYSTICLAYFDLNVGCCIRKIVCRHNLRLQRMTPSTREDLCLLLPVLRVWRQKGGGTSNPGPS